MQSQREIGFPTHMRFKAAQRDRARRRGCATIFTTSQFFGGREGIKSPLDSGTMNHSRFRRSFDRYWIHFCWTFRFFRLKNGHRELGAPCNIDFAFLSDILKLYRGHIT